MLSVGHIPNRRVGMIFSSVSTFSYDIYNLVFLILTYGIPMLIMIVCYSLMGRELWGSRSIGEHTERQLESMKSKKKLSSPGKRTAICFVFHLPVLCLTYFDIIFP
uniref:G-protein coupled receptors family 1 profile domain-containing protein n=1 Tax=Anopheles maculatus TaxID=74869 RepID=A0A182SZT3_9DIPT